MKKLLILFLGLSIFAKSEYSFSQKIENPEFQSDKEIYLEALESLDSWNYYIRNNLDSLKLDAFRILLLGVEKNNEFAINVGKRSLGSYLIRTGKQTSGIKYLRQSLSFFEKRGDYVLKTEILNEIGNGYLILGKPTIAEEFYLKSLKAGKDSPDHTSAFLAESNLAQAYIQLGNLSKASAILHHYKNESLKIQKLESVSNAYALLGTIEQSKGNVSLAKEFFRKSAEFGFKSSSVSQIAQAYNNMAIVLFEQGEHTSSLNYFEKALEMRIKSGNARSISESYFNLGGFYHELRDYEKANKYYKISETYSEKKHLLRERLDALQAQAELLEDQGKEVEALELYKNYYSLMEEYYSNQSSERTEDSEFILNLENLEQENAAKAKEANMFNIIEKNNFQMKILYGACLFSILALLFLVFYRRKIS